MRGWLRFPLHSVPASMLGQNTAMPASCSTLPGRASAWDAGYSPSDPAAMQVCGLLQVLCDANTGRVSEIEIASPDNIMDHYPELRNVMRDRSAASCSLVLVC